MLRDINDLNHPALQKEIKRAKELTGYNSGNMHPVTIELLNDGILCHCIHSSYYDSGYTLNNKNVLVDYINFVNYSDEDLNVTNFVKCFSKYKEWKNSKILYVLDNSRRDGNTPYYNDWQHIVGKDRFSVHKMVMFDTIKRACSNLRKKYYIDIENSYDNIFKRFKVLLYSDGYPITSYKELLLTLCYAIPILKTNPFLYNEIQDYLRNELMLSDRTLDTWHKAVSVIIEFEKLAVDKSITDEKLFSYYISAIRDIDRGTRIVRDYLLGSYIFGIIPESRVKVIKEITSMSSYSIHALKKLLCWNINIVDNRIWH